jgi:3-oxoadipate enol-lactonase
VTGAEQRVLRVDGRRIAYDVTGSGPDLVLLHPVGLDAGYWAGHAARLAVDHRVIAVDLRGHGRSDKAAAGTSLVDLAADVAAVLRAEETRAAVVAGVSMGGMVAQYLAIADPALVGALVLCSTSGGFPEQARPAVAARGEVAMAEGMTAVVDATLERWYSPAGRDSALGRRTAATLLADDPTSWAACWRAISALDTLGALGALDVPALVVTGERDSSTTPEMSVALADALRHATLELVPDAWHLGAFEQEEEFARRFRSFLRGRDRG